jgi:hypothetical protein
MNATQKWISDLLGGNVYVKDEPDDTAQDVTGDSSQSPPQYSPTATTTSGPPHPSVAPAIPLAHVNELAAQRKINMTWEASFSGPPHMPIWTVRCLGMRYSIHRECTLTYSFQSTASPTVKAPTPIRKRRRRRRPQTHTGTVLRSVAYPINRDLVSSPHHAINTFLCICE